MFTSKTLGFPLIEQGSFNKYLLSLAVNFYVKQVLGLIIVGAVFLLIFRQGDIDFKISRFWFDSVNDYFPLKNHYWLEQLNHRLLKYLIILFGCFVLVWGIYRKQADCIILALLLAVGVLAVAILKQNSVHSCPWSLSEFGGNASFLRLFQSPSTEAYLGQGKCFPGGHASSGFSLMALFFWFYPRKPLLAITVWCAAVLLGLLMGFGQVARGAHFFSHNLWSGWSVWASQLALYWAIDRAFLAPNKQGESKCSL